MKNFSEETKDKIIPLFADYFIDPVITEHLFPRELEDQHDLLLLFYDFYTSYNKDKVFISDDEKAAILWYPPNTKFIVPSFKELYNNFSHLMAFGVKVVLRLLTYYSWLSGYKKKILNDDEYCYLESFALDMTGQDNTNPKRNSSSDDLILPVIEEAKNRSCFFYTETYTENNIEFFGEYGFKLFHKNILPGTEHTQYHLRLDI